jgi:hypothetical protein
VSPGPASSRGSSFSQSEIISGSRGSSPIGVSCALMSPSCLQPR